MLLIADLSTSADGQLLRLLLVAGLFIMLGVSFFAAALYWRKIEAQAPPPPPPLQLIFNEREDVASDGLGCKTVCVQAKNTSARRTLTGVNVRLERLDAVRRSHLPGSVIDTCLQMPLLPLGKEELADGTISLGPGEAVSYVLAKSIVGDGFLYLPGRNEPGMPPPQKVTLVPYVATLVATAQNAPQDSLALELPVAGRGIGSPKVRGKALASDVGGGAVT